MNIPRKLFLTLVAEYCHQLEEVDKKIDRRRKSGKNGVWYLGTPEDGDDQAH